MDSPEFRSPAPLVVFATTLVIYAGEYLGRAALGEVDELVPAVLMTLGVASVAAGITALAARVGVGGFVLGLAIAWAPYASGGLEEIRLWLTMAVLFVSTASLLLRLRPRIVIGVVAAVCLATAVSHEWARGGPGTRAGSGEHPDIVLLVMDTTRRDHLSAYGYPSPTSPNLERFAERAQVYDDAWSVAPWTSPSHASMFTGLLPAEHGVDGALAIAFPEELPTLPASLSEAGYHTGGFPGNPNLFAQGWERGFDVYRPAEYQKNHSLIRILNEVARRWRDPAAHALSDQLLDRAKRWWEANEDGPRFLFVNLIEPHSPYIPSDDAYEQFLGDIPRKEAFAVQGRMRPDGSASPPWKPNETDILNRLYDAEIADMDRRIGELLDWFANRDELDDTLFVITSDHGERLGERGLVGHSLVMDPYLLRVPLLISYPSRLEPDRISTRVQLNGLAGYILHTAGLPAPSAMRGFEESEVAVGQYRPPASIVNDMAEVDPEFDSDQFRHDWSFVTRDRFALQWSETDAPVLTDIESDPDFARNVAADYPEETDALVGIARQLPRFGASETRDSDPELMRKLKALGYVP